MNKSEEYNTKQKEYILEVIKNKQKEFIVKEIYEEVKDKVGLTTIYRLIDKLVSQGVINKVIDENNITHYKYLEKCEEDNHFYLKCNNCGNFTHVDCECIEELSNHILKNHKFEINKENIIINGICAKCNKGVKLC